jgi:polar amino acid transport system substrate-binding protein
MISKLKTLAIGALALTAIAATANAETMRVGMECTYAPFNYRTDAGELAGYDVDVAKGVAEIAGFDIEFVCQEWDGMIPALLANKFDLIVASMSITEKRLEKMDFSAPYRVSIGRLIGPKDADWNLFDDAGNPIAENFAGKRVGLERASTYADWFEAKLPDAEVVFYDGNEPMYLDLQNGRVDMIMTNPMKAHLRFLSQEDGGKFGFVSPAVADEEYFGVGVGIGLRKDQPELKAKLDAAVLELVKTGKLEEYALKIFPFPIHNEKWGQ